VKTLGEAGSEYGAIRRTAYRTAIRGTPTSIVPR
jgi:hypothetical protein